MWLRTSCVLRFDIAAPTPFILMLRPRSGAQQWIASEDYHLEPYVPVLEFSDTYGNLCQRLVAPEGLFSVSTSSEVWVADEIDTAPGAPFITIPNLPDNVLCYLLPSRYCESELFVQMASEITEGYAPGYDQVAAIVQWIKSNISYDPGSSDLPISASEVNIRASGVCRDLAHLCIALCRSLSIPARLVVGYLYQLEPMDMHAWFEVYVGGRWYTFDATQPESKGAYVAIGYGRDAADVALYNQFGPPVFAHEQLVQVELLDKPE